MLTLYPLFFAYNVINSPISGSSSMMRMVTGLFIHRSPYSLYALHFTPRVASFYEQKVNILTCCQPCSQGVPVSFSAESLSGSMRPVSRKGDERPSTHANEP